MEEYWLDMKPDVGGHLKAFVNAFSMWPQLATAQALLQYVRLHPAELHTASTYERLAIRDANRRNGNRSAVWRARAIDKAHVNPPRPLASASPAADGQPPESSHPDERTVDLGQCISRHDLFSV